MRTATFAVVLSLVGLLEVSCAGEREPDKPAEPTARAPTPPAKQKQTLPWKSWREPEGRFAVELPGEPQVTPSSYWVGFGEAREVRYLVDVDGTAYGVIVIEYPPEYVADKPSGQIIANAKRQAVRSFDGFVREETEVKAPSESAEDGIEGKRVFIVSEATEMANYSQWLLDGNTLYQIVLMGPKESVQEEHFQHMISSFSLFGSIEEGDELD